MRAEELGLVGEALRAAVDLQAKFPSVVFTSGRRDLKDQAHAMAVDVVLDRAFIMSTYRNPLCAAATALQSWVTDNFYTPSVDDVAAAFLRILEGFDDDELAKLSKHLGGRAFDVRPVDDPNGIRAWLYARAAQVGGKFLEREGKLILWHFQC